MADYVVVMYAGNVVEKGKVLDIFQNPMHPYTIGLLKSKPIIGKTNHNERLYSIPGQVPNPINMPENCHFNERCEFCQEGCKEKRTKTGTRWKRSLCCMLCQRTGKGGSINEQRK